MGTNSKLFESVFHAEVPPCDCQRATVPLTALYVLIFTNTSFWRAIGAYYADAPLRLAGIAVALLLLYVALFVLFSAKYIIKPMLILFVLIAAGGSYFTDTFGTIIDKYVVEAALTTTQAESGALLTPSFLWHMLILVLFRQY